MINKNFNAPKVTSNPYGNLNFPVEFNQFLSWFFQSALFDYGLKFWPVGANTSKWIFFEWFGSSKVGHLIKTIPNPINQKIKLICPISKPQSKVPPTQPLKNISQVSTPGPLKNFLLLYLIFPIEFLSCLFFYILPLSPQKKKTILSKFKIQNSRNPLF